jgi:hypothetical protein
MSVRKPNSFILKQIIAPFLIGVLVAGIMIFFNNKTAWKVKSLEGISEEQAATTPEDSDLVKSHQ